MNPDQKTLDSVSNQINMAAEGIEQLAHEACTANDIYRVHRLVGKMQTLRVLAHNIEKGRF